MTCVAIWYEAHDNLLWVVGDTRTTNSVSGTLSEASAKIFPLSVTCRVPGPNGFFDQVRLSRTLGFTFAGSTFAALQTYSTLNASLQHMVGLPNLPIPSLLDIAALAGRLGTRYVRETMTSFEMAVLGSCPSTNVLQIVHLDCNPDASPISFRMTQCPNTSSGLPLLLGSHKAEIRRSIAETDALHEHSLRRTPKQVLDEIIKGGRYPDIGGMLQVGMTIGTNFELVSVVRPLEGGPQCAPFFAGLDIDAEIGNVGLFRVSPMGII